IGLRGEQGSRTASSHTLVYQDDRLRSTSQTPRISAGRSARGRNTGRARAHEASQAWSSRSTTGGRQPTCCPISGTSVDGWCPMRTTHGGRMLKTTVTLYPDGRFTLTTTNRGEAASRWVAQMQAKEGLGL